MDQPTATAAVPAAAHLDMAEVRSLLDGPNSLEQVLHAAHRLAVVFALSLAFVLIAAGA